MKVFSFDNKDNPVVMVEIKGEVLIDACWLPQNPNMIIAATAEGSVYLYDLGETIEKPMETIIVQKNPVDQISSVTVSTSQNSILVLSKMGYLWQFTLSSAIFDDRFVLDKIYTG